MNTDLRLYQVPAALDALDDELNQLHSTALPAEIDPAYPEALAAYQERQASLELKLQAMTSSIAALGAGYHAWLRRLKDEAEAAKAEAQRVQAMRQVREAKLERIKTYVRDTLLAAQLPKLEGPSWRLRVQKNGGVKPVRWAETEPVPVALAAKVALSPAALVAAARALASSPLEASAYTDEEVLSYFTDEPLVFSAERAWAVIKDQDGEIPDGVEVLEPGKHLRVE